VHKAPDRPGKHRARHKAPCRVNRLDERLRPPTIRVRSRALRRHGSTLAALGGVAIAATAVSGSTFGSEGVERVAESLGRGAWTSAAELTSERTEGPSRASRDSVRDQISQLRTEVDADERSGGVGSAPQLTDRVGIRLHPGRVRRPLRGQRLQERQQLVPTTHGDPCRRTSVSARMAVFSSPS
jgi:hypothetical protein